YCITVAFISYFYLQRYDIFPAVLTLASLLCFGRGWFGWAGAMLAIGGAVKLYPLLLGPILWIIAIHRSGGARFAAGVVLALLPLAALSFMLPWWRFLAFHGQRGLQVESLYASIIWLAHLLGPVAANWTSVKAWTEVTGPNAAALVPLAKLIMLSTTLGSVAFATWVAARRPALNIYQ